VLFLLLWCLGASSLIAQEGMKADSLMQELQYAEADTTLLRLNLLIADDLIFVDPDTTEFFLERALILAEELKDTASLARILNLKGIWTSMRGRLLSGLELYQSSLKYYEALGDEIGASKCINNIGTIYSELGNDSMAVENFKDSFKITSRIGKKRNAANNLHNISSSYLGIGMIDSARHYAQLLQEYQAEAGEVYIDESSLLGQVYLEEGLLDSALHHYQKFHDFVESQNDEYFLTSTKVSLADVHRQKGNYPKALNLLNTAEERALSLNLTDILLNIYKGKAEVFEKTGNFTDAYISQVKYQSLKDSLDLLNNASQINELNARYEAAKREKEIMGKDLIIAEQEASRQTVTKIAVLVVISVLIITAIVAFFLFKNRKINKVLNAQNKEIRKQRHNITSSINYAKKIQNSILVPEDILKQHFPDSFVYFKPRDIVSGDFYWFAEVENQIMLSTVDCTGHGVPGAFMSLIANSKLNKVVNEKKIYNPSDVLNEVHKEIVQSLNQDGGTHQAQDGMDMSLCLIDKENRKIRFAGAQNAIYLVQGDSLEEIKADALSIGGTAFATKMNGHNFSTREISYEPGTFMFMCTDGLLDQFGGEEGKKFNKARFRKLLLEVSNKGFVHAKSYIDENFHDWRRSHPQLDDILIIGTRL
jgi:serine phosphatase RsbU (regulator of sigma subunit)/predicted negative regulator of RcsB-dependent stress response